MNPKLFLRIRDYGRKKLKHLKLVIPCVGVHLSTSLFKSKGELGPRRQDEFCDDKTYIQVQRRDNTSKEMR